MYKIGEFSKLSFITIQALRHYDELGLLKPAEVDGATGYRYYKAEQLPKANLIVALKHLGLSLGDIGQALGGDDLTSVQGLLEQHREQLARNLEDMEMRKARLEGLLLQIRGGAVQAPWEVVLKQVQPQRVAFIRRVTRGFSPEAIQGMFGALVAWVLASGAGFAGPTGLTYHDADYQEDTPDISVFAPIANAAVPTGEIQLGNLPEACGVASLTYVGPYDRMAGAYACLMSWIASQRASISGPCREIYHVSPGETQDPNAYITEIQVPVTLPQGMATES